MLEIVPVLLVFVVLVTLTMIIGNAVLNLGRDPIRARLMGSRTASVAGPTDGKDSIVSAMADQLPATSSDNGRLDRDLRRAGFYQNNARNYYLAIRNSLVWGILIVVGLVCVVLGPDHQQLALRVLIVGAVAAALSWSIPRVVLHYLGENRVERINRGLPDALDMLTMCLSGGLSVQQSLEHVSRELRIAHTDLAVELYVVRRQAEMSSIYEALDQFNKRIDTNDVIGFSSLVDQNSRLGTDISSAMGGYADDLRMNRNQLADERANKASVQLLLPIVFFLLPAVFIILWGPAVLELVEFLQDFGGLSE